MDQINSRDHGNLWYEHMTTNQLGIIISMPTGFLVLFVLLLRVVWRPREPKFRLPKQVPVYGTMIYERYDSFVDSICDEGDDSDVIYAGQVAGTYEERWTKTFDLAFLMFMMFYLVMLIIMTTVLQYSLWTNREFWLYLIPKFLVMSLVSLVGGIVCRYFSIMDDNGYVLTTRISLFKVNYTRKFQHFAAYLVPLLINPPQSCNCSGPLELVWGDYVTLLPFLLMIKPVRERFTLCMLQFNSLDRPEDRPHTLKWLIGGNIIPGLHLLIFFKWLFSQTTQAGLVFVIVLITCIGDGLAEPIGVAIGKHKYSTTTCLSKRKYLRTLEGSACVFLCAMVFPALMYASFTRFTQLWLAMLILPPITSFAEATAPHTMDTPILILVVGGLLYGIIQFV